MKITTSLDVRPATFNPDKRHADICDVHSERIWQQTEERSLALEKRFLSMFQHHVTIKQSNLPGKITNFGAGSLLQSC
jgi:hypothetical protein